MQQHIDSILSALKRDYGVVGRLQSLPGERDLNYYVQASGKRYVFKAMHPDCDPAFVDMQIEAMDHVRNAPDGPEIPAIIRTHSGAAKITFVDGNGVDRVGWLLSFLDGVVMAEVKRWTPYLTASLGRKLAHMSRALEGFEHPLLDRELKWDLRQGGWIKDYTHVFEDIRKRRMIESIVERFVEDISPILNTRARTPIYGDANDMNIFVQMNGVGVQEVSGIIDFGDMSRTPLICEPAIAMTYSMMREGDQIVRGAALAAGFHEILPFADEDLSLLLPLVKMRLAISVTNAAVQRSQHPDNEYLSISEAPAWQLLETLFGFDEAVVEKQFRAACTEARPKSAAPKSSQLHTIERRKTIAPENLKLSYEKPLKFVRGIRHFLFDEHHNQYLDAYNNVPHVGHANPVVVEAVAQQMSRLNTNTRYLQDVHIDYAERMIGLLPENLSKIVFLNSASEANEFALRLVRAYTNARDMIVMDHGYHGGTTGAMAISPYKFNHSRGAGAPPEWVHVTSQPDIYRGPHRGDDAAEKYIADLDAVLTTLAANNRPLAGFICECVPSVGGQIMLPEGYLAATYKKIRSAGGLCIADDVQTALGRLGDCFWGFEQQGVTPDIVVMGKPLGNGYPLAAVAMTQEIAEAFAKGPEFFSTFGGSSAACAAGSAVLDVLMDNRLQENARIVGAIIKDGLEELAQTHEIIGDVRGSGFFIGADLVLDRQRRQAATLQADYIKNRMRERKILIGVEGPEDNVLKIRPPMTFNKAAADQLLTILDEILREEQARV